MCLCDDDIKTDIEDMECDDVIWFIWLRRGYNNGHFLDLAKDYWLSKEFYTVKWLEISSVFPETL